VVGGPHKKNKKKKNYWLGKVPITKRDSTSKKIRIIRNICSCEKELWWPMWKTHNYYAGGNQTQNIKARFEKKQKTRRVFWGVLWRKNRKKKARVPPLAKRVKKKRKPQSKGSQKKWKTSNTGTFLKE